MIPFNQPLQFGDQIHSYASSDENSGCESCSGQRKQRMSSKDNLIVQDKQPMQYPLKPK